MIATLNFDRCARDLPGQPAWQPGLRRIDEILAVVLERYETDSLTPGPAAERFSAKSLADCGSTAESRPRPR